MPRKTRYSSCGDYYHVIIRGNNKARIFFSSEDRLYFMSLLGEGVTKYKYKIHAFCLMSNHVHIALQVDEISISKIMHNINFRYAKWLNSTQKRVGHVFQGRYKSIFVASKSQLLELVRYIHLNPVKANIVKFAGSYKWSSYKAYLGRNNYSWLTTDTLLNILDCNNKDALDKYKFMHSAISPKVELLLEYGEEVPIEDYFRNYPDIKEYSTMKIQFSDIIKSVCSYFTISEIDLISSSRKRGFSRARGAVVWLVKELKVGTLAHCAVVFKRNESVLMRVADRLQNDENSLTLLRYLKELLIRQ